MPCIAQSLSRNSGDSSPPRSTAGRFPSERPVPCFRDIVRAAACLAEYPQVKAARVSTLEGPAVDVDLSADQWSRRPQLAKKFARREGDLLASVDSCWPSGVSLPMIIKKSGLQRLDRRIASLVDDFKVNSHDKIDLQGTGVPLMCDFSQRRVSPWRALELLIINFR